MDHLTPEAIRVLGVCAIFCFAILGALIYGLLEHQRRMAEIMRSDRKQTDGLDQRVDSLQSEIRELKSLLTSKAHEQQEGNDLQQRIR